MGTRCEIGIVKDDGSIESIFCHYDGYISGVGATLLEFYNTKEKVVALMKCGHLCGLGACPSECIREDWSTNVPNYYFKKLSKAFYENGSDDNGIGRNFEYLYFFKDGKWMVSYMKRTRDWYTWVRVVVPLDKAI